MKILFTSPIIEFPAKGGPQLRIENSVKALNKISDLYVYARTTPVGIGGELAIEFYKKNSKDFRFCKTRGLSSNKYIRKTQRLYHNFNKTTIKEICNIIQKENIDILWVGFGNISHKLISGVRRRLPNVKMICDTDSVWSRFILREIPFVSSLKQKKELERKGLLKQEQERSWVDLCNIITAVSSVDAQYYQSLTEQKDKIKLFSNVIDLDKYQQGAPPKDFVKPCMYLAGTFGQKTSSMDRAATWVLEKVLPIVRKSIPDIHLYIVGANSDRNFGDINDANITVTGSLPSVLPYLTNASVSLVPLMFESGTRFKILEAGACKVPCVSTTLGAEGIPVKNNHGIHIADKEEDFAKAIIKLIKEPFFARDIAENCYNLVAENYSVNSLVEEAKDIIECLQND